MWLLSYITANLALILVVLLAVAGCGLIFWITKNLWAVVTAVVILAAGFAYQQVDKSAYQRRVSEEAAAQTRVLQSRLDAVTDINNANTARAVEDQVKIEELEKLANETPANNTACLDPEAAARIGAIK